MKPAACINCGKGFWQGAKSKPTELDAALDHYCRTCRTTALKVNEIVSNRRLRKQVAEDLDREYLSEIRKYL